MAKGCGKLSNHQKLNDYLDVENNKINKKTNKSNGPKTSTDMGVFDYIFKRMNKNFNKAIKLAKEAEGIQ